MKKFFEYIFITLLTIFLFLPQKVEAITQAPESSPEAVLFNEQEDYQAVVHIFASKTCPHCKEERKFFEQYKKDHPEVKVNCYYTENAVNAKIYQLVAMAANSNGQGVPFTVIGNQYMVGFGSAKDSGVELIALIKDAQENQAPDNVSNIIRESGLFPIVEVVQAAEDSNEDSNTKNELIQVSKDTITLPIFGELDVNQLSLPVLTFVIAFLDGFNPCAMWTLLFLISLLLGMKDKRRMWILGITFIIASGFVYFLFMSAWLNFFLFIGLVVWVRILIGLVALGTGAYYLRDFQKNKSGECKVDLGGKKQKVFAKLKEITYKKELIFALVGIVLLAFAVNLVELVCSAGLPAIYTQVLSLSNLPVWQYYLYLFFYILIFMLDDIVVFVIAMKTLHAVGLNTKYARYSHLIGGIVMFLIGLAMIFKPELLMFG